MKQFSREELVKSFIVVGLGNGDEGKGTCVDALVKNHNATCVVRYNGGAQAAHNVVTSNGKHHTFAQFGSGTFNPRAETFLSRHMLVNPLTMLVENAALEYAGVTDALYRMFIDERALVTTPYHRALNRLRELARGDGRHGSCGMGIGETMQDFLKRGAESIHIADFLDRETLRTKLVETRHVMFNATHLLGLESVENLLIDKELSTFEVPIDTVLTRYTDFVQKVNILHENEIKEYFNRHSSLVFEGAQGVLLDENYGFHPYTTWSTTTTENAHQILQEFNISGPISEIGVIRSFCTRHGPGPFATESDKLRFILAGDHNGNNQWQRDFRVGWLDMPALRYALQVNGSVDSLAVTHVDKLAAMDEWKVAVDYGFELEPSTSLEGQEALGKRIDPSKVTYEDVKSDTLLEWISEKSGINVSMTSHGPKTSDKTFLK